MKTMSQEAGGKIKNYIKGVTNAEELKQDSKIHYHNSSSERQGGRKKLKIESKSILNNNINRRKPQKNNTYVANVSNLRNLKKEIKCIAKKITGKKACGKSIDKEKEKILL